jgi:hypothetical protein
VFCYFLPYERYEKEFTEEKKRDEKGTCKVEDIVLNKQFPHPNN